MPSSRSLRGVQIIESGLGCRHLEGVGRLASEVFARSGGACQTIIVMERAENLSRNDVASIWNRVPRRSRVDGKIARRLRDVGSE